MAQAMPPLLVNSSTFFACSFDKNGKTFPFPSRHHHRVRRTSITCKARDESREDYKLDRRDVLIGLGGVYGAAAGLGIEQQAEAKPIGIPDLTKCQRTPAPIDKTVLLNCCPPVEKKIIEFVLPPKSDPPRVRLPCHLLDADYISKYTRAVEIMKSLPDDDPRSFKQQAAVHCAYCNGAFDQLPSYPNEEIEVHFAWTFFPWHRFYLYFYEKILGKLIGDPSFALPYWNWDASPYYEMPSMFTNPLSPLYDCFRNPKHKPPAKVDLAYDGTDKTFTSAELIAHNNGVMYRDIVSGAKTAELFMGKPYRLGDKRWPGGGTVENGCHGAVHLWVGDPDQGNLDMGNLFSSGRDPIFYSHHANVDRMWDIWKALGRKDFTDPDFRNAEFLFYDENKQLVKVKFEQALDSSKLGYSYKKVDIPWLDAKPSSKAKDKKDTLKPIKTAKDAPKFPLIVDKPVSVTVKRPKLKRGQPEKEEEEEVLEVLGIEFDSDLFVRLDVYLNATDALGPAASEFAGSFTNVPRKAKAGGSQKLTTNVALGITDLLEDLDAEDDDSIVVTFVVGPTAKGKVSIGGAEIIFAKIPK